MPPKKPTVEYPVVLFANEAEWEQWLEEHHADADGVWIRFAKKGAPYSTVTYKQALDIALCFGWIDSLVRTYDEHSYQQKFTPRGRRSLWSKINREKAEALEKAGRLRPAGIAAIDAAKVDGRWETAYDSASRAVVPDVLQAALDANPAAKRFFETLDRANRYSIIWRVQTALTDATRQKRVARLVEMLERGEKIH